MELLKLLSGNEVIAQIFSFLILFFLLRKFAWNKILRLLDERRQRLANEFKNIEEEKAEITRLRAEYEEKIARIKEEADRIIQEAGLEGRRITEEIRKNANLEAQEIINSAKEEIKYQLLAAREELKEKIVDLIIAATEQVIQERLTEEDDLKIIRDFLEKVDKL
ncbi:MAG: F0F1 ATP synthase subunit B [Candidatus Omnitrophica bacterium]|nr:F0F1 ATP synthase subunit B [Candidatus Omnitrophota bacterium]